MASKKAGGLREGEAEKQTGKHKCKEAADTRNNEKAE